MRITRSVILAVLAIAVGGASVWSTPETPATTPATTPTTAAVTPVNSVLARGLIPGSRVLKTFDFEEKPLGNYEKLPMYWNKVAGLGYPLYASGAFDETVSHSKKTSFKLELDGGSVAYQLQPGRLPITPNADYYITGFVKTTALQHAKAEIVAWYADADGKVLGHTEVHTERWASSTGKDDWTLLHMFVPGTEPAARSLVLQVGLFQPQQLSNKRLGKFELYEQDIKGTAWFDDIVVYQLPRLSITCPAMGGIVPPNQHAELNVVVSDLGRDYLTADVTVADSAGNAVLKKQSALATSPDKPWQLHLDLGQLAPAEYAATLDVRDAKGLVTRRTTRFVTTTIVGPGGRPAPEFGIDASAWPVDAWPELPTILEHTGAGLAKMPAWRRDMSEESLLRRDPPFDQLINALQRNDVATIASFSEIPSALTTKVNEKADSVLALLDVDQNLWRPYVTFILARYAQRVDLWELGQARDLFYSPDPRYAKLYKKTQGELATLLTGPRLVIPWNAMFDYDPRQFPGAILDLRLPSSIRPAQIPAYIQSFTDHKAQVLAVIEPTPEGQYPRTERLNDFAQRIVWARTMNPRAVMIDLPVVRQATLTERASLPSELLLVYRTLVRELGGSTYKGELQLHPGVRAFLFDRAGIGTIVLWNESAASPKPTISLALGKTPASVDLAGRTSQLEVKDGTCQLTVTAAPLIIDNVDSRLAELCGSFGLGLKVIPAGAGTVQTTVRLRNPYDAPLSGTLRLSGPQGWSIEPPTVTLNLPPGGKLEQAVTIHYPYGAFAGPKDFRGRLAVDRESRAIELLATADLASEQVEMECFTHVTPAGDLILQQMITNTSAVPLNAQAYAMVPGFARQQRFVLDLQPGQKVIKRFTFPASALEGKAAAVGLRQTDGTTLITKAVPLN